jgi:hypothetical protein
VKRILSSARAEIRANQLRRHVLSMKDHFIGAEESKLESSTSRSVPVRGSRAEKLRPSERVGKLAVGAGATGAMAVGALAVGAISVGALAIGALAIGRLAIRRLAVGRTRLARLEIRELDVRRLQVEELIIAGKRVTPDDGPKTK